MTDSPVIGEVKIGNLSKGVHRIQGHVKGRLRLFETAPFTLYSPIVRNEMSDVVLTATKENLTK